MDENEGDSDPAEGISEVRFEEEVFAVDEEASGIKNLTAVFFLKVQEEKTVNGKMKSTVIVSRLSFITVPFFYLYSIINR